MTLTTTSATAGIGSAPRVSPPRGSRPVALGMDHGRMRVIDFVRLSAGRMEVPAAALTQPTPGEPVDEGVRSAEFRGALAAYDAAQAAVESREAKPRSCRSTASPWKCSAQACPRRVDARQRPSLERWCRTHSGGTIF
jgi:hypothetical protein